MGLVEATTLPAALGRMSSMSKTHPFLIEKTVSSVAYRLALPSDCKIFHAFHIGLLKEFKGDDPTHAPGTIPPLTLDSHPGVISQQIMACRVITKKGKKVGQVLVDWLGLSQMRNHGKI